MLPTTVEALVIIALVLSPGYVFTQVARRVIPHVQEPTDFRFLLMVITVGTLIQGLMFPWTSHILDYYLAHTLPAHRLAVVLWAVAVVFVVPVVLGVAVGRLTLNRWVEAALDFVGLGYVDRMPSAWDFVLRQQAPTYVRVHLKGGQGIVGGVYGGASFGSLDPNRADIYLEQAWQLTDDGVFLQALPSNSGLWVAHDVMAFVYFLEGEDSPDAEEDGSSEDPIKG